METLLITACVRENSRTMQLAKKVVEPYSDHITVLDLCQVHLQPLDRASLSERDRLLYAGALDAPRFSYARQFANARRIIIAAPFWDLSVPAILKTYIENICAVGITFRYLDGVPCGLCRAEELIFVTTCGGPFVPDYGYHYLRALAKTFFGIPETRCVYQENVDVDPRNLQDIKHCV